jgi:hypothetical protein
MKSGEEIRNIQVMSRAKKKERTREEFIEATNGQT